MTVIVAVNDKQNKQIILGSDTQTTCGQVKSETETKIITKEVDVVDGYDKKIKNITLHIAVCGRAYMQNFIQYGFDAPKMKDSMSIIEYLYKDFLPKLTAKLGDNKLIKERYNQSDSQSEMLMFETNVYC